MARNKRKYSIPNIPGIFDQDFPMMTKKQIEDLPQDHMIFKLKETQGIYGIFLCNECVYIGQSRDLFQRITQHMKYLNYPKSKLNKNVDQKYLLLKKFKKYLSIKILEFTKTYRKRIEKTYIDKHEPIFNINQLNSFKYFTGTEEDIEDFVLGLKTMKDLKSLVINKSDRD